MDQDKFKKDIEVMRVQDDFLLKKSCHTDHFLMIKWLVLKSWGQTIFKVKSWGPHDFY